MGHDLAYKGVSSVQCLRNLCWRFHQEIKREGARLEQTRHTHIAVHRLGLGVHNNQEVDIAIRRGGAIDIGPKESRATIPWT
jgi:hypothetical protein